MIVVIKKEGFYTLLIISFVFDSAGGFQFFGGLYRLGHVSLVISASLFGVVELIMRVD